MWMKKKSFRGVCWRSSRSSYGCCWAGRPPVAGGGRVTTATCMIFIGLVVKNKEPDVFFEENVDEDGEPTYEERTCIISLVNGCLAASAVPKPIIWLDFTNTTNTSLDSWLSLMIIIIVFVSNWSQLLLLPWRRKWILSSECRLTWRLTAWTNSSVAGSTRMCRWWLVTYYKMWSILIGCCYKIVCVN